MEFRFVEKFLPDDAKLKCPDDRDLAIMVLVTQLYNDIITNKPVYTVALHNKVKKAGNNSLELPKSMYEGVDAEFLIENQRLKGLVN